MKSLNNNLRNVKAKDPIFKRLSNFILEHAMDEEDKARLDSELLSIIAGDSYFTFYSYMPTLESKNENEVLEVIRRFMMEFFESDTFEKTHNITRLDHEVSMVHSITFMRELLRLIKQDPKLSPSFAKRRRIIPRALPSGGEEKSESDRLLKALEKAFEKASKTAKNAKEIKNYIGGSKAGKKPGTFEKLLELSNLITSVYGAEKIISLAKEITRWAPKFTTVKKVKSKFGDEIGGYRISRELSKATPKELALLEELFEYKMVGGVVSREKQYPTIGGYYVLVDKCLPGDSRVTMANGDLLEIEDLKVGDEVLSVEVGGDNLHFKPARVFGKTCSKLRRVYAITTRCGVLRATSNHVLPIVRSDGLTWTSIGSLKPGDMILKVESYSPRECRVKRVRVESVRFESIEERVYDITLEHNHHFLAQDFIVHNSGSMLGPKTLWARSVALSLLKISIKSNTRYYLRFFDTQTHPEHPIVEPEEAIEHLVTVWSDGGTDIDRAILTACKDMVEGVKELEKYTNTIVIITDGQDEVDSEQVREALENANARLVSVMVQGDNASLKKASHQYFKASLDLKGALKLVEAVK